MVVIDFDLDRFDKAYFFCKNCCKRWKLLVKKKVKCPKCKEGGLIHASIHMWKLVDALKKELKSQDLVYRLVEEVPLVETKHNFCYHADVGIWLTDSRVGLIVDLIPANPNDGRYKAKIRLAEELQERFDIRIRRVMPKECGKVTASFTARDIVKKLIKRSELKNPPF